MHSFFLLPAFHIHLVWGRNDKILSLRVLHVSVRLFVISLVFDSAIWKSKSYHRTLTQLLSQRRKGKLPASHKSFYILLLFSPLCSVAFQKLPDSPNPTQIYFLSISFFLFFHRGVVFASPSDTPWDGLWREAGVCAPSMPQMSGPMFDPRTLTPWSCGGTFPQRKATLLPLRSYCEERCGAKPLLFQA